MSTQFQQKTIDEFEVRGKISIEDLVRLQIDRCNVSSTLPDRRYFEINVMRLMQMLPSYILKDVKSKKSEYEKTEIRPKFAEVCGSKIGTVDRPIYANLPTDWDWDGGKPILVSPKMEEVKFVDYNRLYEIIMEGFESVNATWNIDLELVELGRVKTPPIKDVPPTPYYGDKKPPTVVEDEDEEEDVKP